MLKRIVLITLAIVVAVTGTGVAYLFLRKPAMAPASSIKVAMTEANIARGKYLFNTVCDCNGCHSEKDFSRFGGPVIPGFNHWRDTSPAPVSHWKSLDAGERSMAGDRDKSCQAFMRSGFISFLGLGHGQFSGQEQRQCSTGTGVHANVRGNVISN